MSRATPQPPLGHDATSNSAVAQWQAADLIVAYLEQIGVEFVFGVPGGAIEPLYNALARSTRRGTVRPIVARHESGAAFMADGYYRETGKLGVCCATTGPGATNILTGVASAYENDIPMLVITGQTALPTFGNAALQESSCTGINTVSMFETCTAYNTLVSHVSQFEHKLVTALRAAHMARKPVHLSVPVDLMRSGVSSGASYQISEYIRRPKLLDQDAVSSLRERLEQANKPVFVIGKQCADAIEEILELAMLLDMPFVTTPDAKGLVSPWHRLYQGVFGFAGHTAARAMLQQDGIDLVVAVGTRLSEWSNSGWDASLLNDKLVHIADTQDYLSSTPMAQLHVQGDLRTIFETLLTNLHDSRSRGTVRLASARQDHSATYERPAYASDAEPSCVAVDRVSYYSEKSPIKPQRLMRELGRIMPSGTRYFADSGNSVAWATHYLHPLDSSPMGRRLRCSVNVTMDFASMGWAIGSSVGCALGNRKSNVVCITGDGSFLMSGQELTVAVAEKLNVIFVILNDSALGMVKHGQQLAGAEPIAFELPHINFAAMAQAMGAHGIVIKAPQCLQDLDIQSLCSLGGPTVIDVHIDSNEVPPMGVRIKVLQGE